MHFDVSLNWQFLVGEKRVENENKILRLNYYLLSGAMVRIWNLIGGTSIVE